jgi:hypothetical protein
MTEYMSTFIIGRCPVQNGPLPRLFNVFLLLLETRLGVTIGDFARKYAIFRQLQRHAGNDTIVGAIPISE